MKERTRELLDRIHEYMNYAQEDLRTLRKKRALAYEEGSSGGYSKACAAYRKRKAVLDDNLARMVAEMVASETIIGEFEQREQGEA